LLRAGHSGELGLAPAVLLAQFTHGAAKARPTVRREAVLPTRRTGDWG
jgi:hypothetical protein